MRLNSIVLVGVLLAGSNLCGATLRVPTQYPTIQGAIDAAVDGDRVDVAPGVYEESVSFSGKNIHVRSEFGPALTTIQGVGGPVVQFVSGETRAAILEGFGITGGNATIGAGVYVAESSPTILGNWIYANPSPTDPVATRGGGIGFFNADGPIVEGNIIVDNRAILGGGVSTNVSNVVFRRNIVARNIALESGGGLLLSIGSFLVEDCLIVENDVEDAPFGGGGVFVESSLVQLYGSTVAGNTTSGGFLPGVYVEFDSVIDVQNCILWGNRSETPSATISEMQLFVSVSSTGFVSFCNVEGGVIGVDSMSEEPAFRTGPGWTVPPFADLGEYFLQHVETGDVETSPCVDAGNPLTPPPVGSTRADGEPDLGNVDLGFHYSVTRFRRGDVDLNGTVNLADPVASLSALFVPGTSAAACSDSADANDDGRHDISDALYVLSWLFVPGSPEIPEPGLACGVDRTPDALSCTQGSCP